VAIIADLRAQLARVNQSLTLSLQINERLISGILPAAPPSVPVPLFPPAAPWTFAQSSTFDFPVNSSTGLETGPSTGLMKNAIQSLFNDNYSTPVAVVLRQSSFFSVLAPDGSDPAEVENTFRLILCSNRSTCEVTLASAQRRRALSTQLIFSVLLGLLSFERLDAVPTVSERQLAQGLGVNESGFAVPSPTISAITARVTIDSTESIDWQCDGGVAGAIAGAFGFNCSRITLIEGPDVVFPPFLPPIIPPSPSPPPLPQPPPYPDLPPLVPAPSAPPSNPHPQLPPSPVPGLDTTEQALLVGGGKDSWSGVSIALLVISILNVLYCTWVWCFLAVKGISSRRTSQTAADPERTKEADQKEAGEARHEIKSAPIEVELKSEPKRDVQPTRPDVALTPTTWRPANQQWKPRADHAIEEPLPRRPDRITIDDDPKFPQTSTPMRAQDPTFRGSPPATLSLSSERQRVFNV